MMVVQAFNQVQQALRWFVDHYAKIADWRAALNRISAFHQHIRTIDDVEDDESRIARVDHPEGHLSFTEVSVQLADGGVIIREASARSPRRPRVIPANRVRKERYSRNRGIGRGARVRSLAAPRTDAFLPQKLICSRELVAAVSIPRASQRSGARARAALIASGRQFIPSSTGGAWASSALGPPPRLGCARYCAQPRWISSTKPPAPSTKTTSRREVDSSASRRVGGRRHGHVQYRESHTRTSRW